MSQGKPVQDPLQPLRRFTMARIGLGHAGVSVPTAAQLAFQLAHARARDAVRQTLDAARLQRMIEQALPSPPPVLRLHSAAANRDVYLHRPDLGRQLDEPSRLALQSMDREEDAYDLAIVIADGLSALAIEQNAAPFLQALQQCIEPEEWSLAPIAIVEQARVAIGDEVGAVLGARAVVVLIGERPGLSSPDSMGLYLTWQPRVGLTDESRNCISNVRPAGMRYPDAAVKLHYLLSEARKRQLTGIHLKDETSGNADLTGSGGDGFLL
ncbi:ethanolamine ammonia-lyase subunit EutC [Noviherbaspirillum pedocola]|uniref:Ethanolamine ammonia-lyase small subunit n=1 Tax=Noviherbaspirillum pedocola TaxID=2801341 RepID=A0A934SU68_9BURK|nr:ethanolamine ammonia-lyase subunit EutC [Noviherbaspirillum pedocola]MBK4735303.1 ethanolamine ammonia-lyase subunit EutC [Noviherbaspirillum pedocola]